MGGKSRKSGRVSKRLITALKQGRFGDSDRGKCCGDKKKSDTDQGFDLVSREDKD